MSRPGPARRGCCDRVAARDDEVLCSTCAPTVCGSCRYLHGQHAPSCRAGVCHGCGARAAVGTKFFCPACRAQRCRCGRYGAHRPLPACQPPRRARLTTVYGVTTADHLVDLFNDAHAKAVSIARYVGGLNRPDAEDVVSEVFLYLWRKRDLLKAPPGRAYLFKAVEHGALRVHQGRWARTTVAMDPDDLVLAEQAMYDRTGATMAVPV